MSPEELKRYWTTELRWGWGHQSQRVFDFLVDAGRFAAGGVILDAGAGHQRYKPFFDDCLYLTQEHPAGIEFKRMQGIDYDLVAPIDERIPLLDDSVDAVINTSVVEHVRYPERFFAEALRVLVPGGRMYVNVPFAYPEHEVPYDFQRPTRYGLARWLEDAGYEQVQVVPSSSSTETALAFLRSSIEQDLFRDTPISRGRLLAKAWAWAKSQPLRFLGTALLWSLTVPMVKLLELVARRFVDRGPSEATTFPVGWIAIATKPGVRVRRQHASREAFLRDRAG